MKSLTFQQITGAEGALRISNRVAATLRSWTLMPGDAPGSWVFSARLKDVDTFLLAQHPETVVLPFGSGTLRFQSPLEISGDHVQATLSRAPEVR